VDAREPRVAGRGAVKVRDERRIACRGARGGQPLDDEVADAP